MACQKVCKQGRDDNNSEGKFAKPHPCIVFTLKNTIGGAGTNDDVISCQGTSMTSFPIILKYSEMNLHVFSEKMVEEFVACE